jgi:hypothetical protein
MANRQVNVNSQETIKNYALVLGAKGITAADLRAAMAEILCEEFFPKPGTLEKLAAPFRDVRLEAEESARLTRLVDCIDADGFGYLAPPSRVRNGLLLPPGDRSGDGSPARPLPTGVRVLGAGGAEILRSLGYEPRERKA